MQIIENKYDNLSPGYPLEKYAPMDKILFIDIETTGLSKEHSNLYLIGSGYFDTDGYHTVQWFAETPYEEDDIITAFTEYVKDRFICLFHYNGNHFDIPYLKYRASVHNLSDPFSLLDNVDIYVLIKPYKKLLGLPSLRQRCVEQFLNINSDDPYTGKELIGVYHSYIKSPSKAKLNLLLYHNSEDLKGMACILPILHYTSLEGIRLHYISHSLHSFNDLDGLTHYELIVDYSHEAYIPATLNTGCGQIRLAMRTDGTAILRLPLINGEFKRFYDNYRDYYYLPAEDCCIHRSVASGVDKSRRVNAKKETCYTKYSGLFIPSISSDTSNTFRSEYRSREFYIPYSEDTCEKTLSAIGESIVDYLF
ncbi:MAG: ribonuclease H-like domain-containing protein [Lachnospiraceae bacterium]|nr:ribonuclease H-like domain-containing protein [Lachnospiraceae bacterium]